MEIIKLFDFQIAESKTFEKTKQKTDENLLKKIENIVYPQLRKNPFYGINIKKLKGEFKGYYRYRIGDYRLFYLIEQEKIIIVIVDLKKRKDSY
jgi:mRNA interferase RelE/StbE